MKWKGGRQSTNIEDRRDEEKEGMDAEDLMPTLPNGQKRYEFDPNDKKEMEIVRELGKHNINGTTPKPTPRPNNKTHYNSQVTPGKWSTKDKI